MGEVMEENQRLKQYLDQAMKDYQTLQKKFHEISQHDSKQQLIKDDHNQMEAPPLIIRPLISDEDGEEAELVSLSLGRSSSLDSKKGKPSSSPSKLPTNHNNNDDDDKEANERSLDLGLECNFKGSSTIDHDQQTLMTGSSVDEHSLDETKDGEALKNSNGNSNGVDEVVHQPPVKKARVSVRVRCDTPTVSAWPCSIQFLTFALCAIFNALL